MKIGIDGSRAFIENRTGIEEYSYQVIKNLRDKLKDHQVVLYVKKTYNLQLTTYNGVVKINDLELPKSWRIKVIKFPRFWTQLGLSLEMLLHPVDVLFVPAHTVPVVHSKNTVVVIHGLEYEFCKKSYSWWDRVYMRGTIKKSCQWAKTIISVSENTKLDLVRLYNVKEDKVRVIYEGYDNFQFPISNFESNQNEKISKIKTLEIYSKFKIQNSKFLLFIGRIEERKNISNIIKAFEILKEKYNISHKLVLAGKPGHGYENIKLQITNSKYKEDIAELGFISEEEKWELLKKADVFVFPTLYEGFGIPVLEAQSVGCAVVASDNSSVPEIVHSKHLLSPGEGAPIAIGADEGGEQYSALLVNPQDPQDIAENIFKLISDESLKNAIIQKGLENVKRFSWDKCAREIAEVLLK
ncbi:MAG: Glycosyl transferase group 1 [Candidatus Moranbacteria bacterium GW2011_GWE1_36_7]|nr:MAG: Glycosyl transferase group 1 [Candidatus Moranbacteria bacterium GW2011_GWD2_36_12]KKQ07039.1 MAG: Glycosyl transferase group 1 [Candidatus Moranbacteria bacterium GW2011_GWE2_36_40]KKQ15383.1 MAG: Glycosyl transferase group 1 [Candidatus Moranbacteria bacterium GW2011_GWE1_36_7]